MDQLSFSVTVRDVSSVIVFAGESARARDFFLPPLFKRGEQRGVCF